MYNFLISIPSSSLATASWSLAENPFPEKKDPMIFRLPTLLGGLRDHKTSWDPVACEDVDFSVFGRFGFVFVCKMTVISDIPEDIKEALLAQHDSTAGEIFSETGEGFVVKDYVEIDGDSITAYRRLKPMKLMWATITGVNLVPPSTITKENLEVKNWKVDKTSLRPRYGVVHVASAFFTEALSLDTENRQEVLMIGLGGGLIPNFLGTIPNISTTSVELNPVFVEIAKNFFGHEEREGRTTTHVADGTEFLRQAAEQEKKYKSIIVDACYESDVVGNGQLGPVKEFLDKEVVQNLFDCLEDDGNISVNTMSIRNREENERKTHQAYGEIFPSCYFVPLFEDQNMLICSKKAYWTWNDQRDRFRRNLQTAIKTFKFDGLELLLNH